MRSTVWASLVLLVGCAVCGWSQERGIGGTAAGKGPQKWAVVVGVGDYQDAGIGDLPNAVHDAVALRDALIAMTDGFESKNVMLLADGQGDANLPTRANIMRFLASYLALSQPNDTFLFYFAGHGVTEDGQLYLLPSDASSVNVGFTGFPFREVERLLKEAPAKKKILVLDACHSGTGRSSPQMSDDAIQELERASRGMVTLASCSGNELSHEMPATGHGAFTYYLLEALDGKADRDKDGVISASEASYYTWDHTRRWAAKQGFRQTPWRREEGSGEIVLAKVTVIRPEPEAPKVSVTPPEPVQPGRPGDAIATPLVSPGTSSLEPEMVLVPGGAFTMGNEARGASRDERPEHEVTVDGFWMSRYEITALQFCAFLNHLAGLGISDRQYVRLGGRSTIVHVAGRYKPLSGCEHHPVNQVSWLGALEFTKWLSNQTGKSYDLPTEAQWEYAARGAEGRLYPWGNEPPSPDRAQFGVSWASARDSLAPVNGHPEGRTPDTRIHHLSGNVWEWCRDAYDKSFYKKSEERNPYCSSSSSSLRVLRGGCCESSADFIRASKRYAQAKQTLDGNLGFRVVLGD